jgi:hypothetical protein
MRAKLLGCEEPMETKHVLFLNRGGRFGRGAYGDGQGVCLVLSRFLALASSPR